MHLLTAWIVLLLLPVATLASGMTVTVDEGLSYVDVVVEPGFGRLEAHSNEIWSHLQVVSNGTKDSSQLIRLAGMIRHNLLSTG